jgi:hypothetical protein
MWMNWPTYYKREVPVGPVKALVCWKLSGAKSELQYIALIGDDYRTSSRYRFLSRHENLQWDGLTGLDSSIFADGAYAQATSGHRCFVYGHRNQIIPVPIPEEDLQKITAANIRSLPETQVWKDHIQPVLDQERAAFEAEHNQRVEEKRQATRGAK